MYIYGYIPACGGEKTNTQWSGRSSVWWFLSSQAAPWVVIKTTYGAASDDVCWFFVFVFLCVYVRFFHETVSPVSWGARCVWTYICIRMCGDVYFMYVWASPHLYIFLIELEDIKCTTTSPNGNIFRVAGLLGGESPGHRWTPITEASGMKLWYFLSDLRLNIQLSKQSRCWWFEALSCSLRRHCKESVGFMRTLVDCTPGHPLTQGPTQIAHVSAVDQGKCGWNQPIPRSNKSEYLWIGMWSGAGDSLNI